METQERQYVLEHLGASETRLLELTDGLSAAQWQFKENAGRWSIAENLEHCILVEHGIDSVIKRALGSPAQPEKRAGAPRKERAVESACDSRGRELVAVEALSPAGRWTDGAALRAELQRVRARSVAFASETEADLREHFFPHQALGDLDCYQWLVIQAQHGERHARQIEQIKRDPAFPAS